MHTHERTLLASLGFADPDKKNPRHDLACQYLALPENHQRIARLLVSDAPKSVTYKVHDEQEWTFSGTRRYAISVGDPTIEWPISKGDGRYKTTIGFVDVVLPFSRTWADEGEACGWRKAGPVDHAVDLSDLPEKWRPYLAALTDSAWDARNVLVPVKSLAPDLQAGHPDGEVGIIVRLRDGAFVATVPTFQRHKFPRSDSGVSEWSACVEVKIGRVGVGDVLRQVALYREHIDGHRTKWILATPFPFDADDLVTLRSASITHVRLGDKFEQWVAQRTAAPRAEDSPEV